MVQYDGTMDGSEQARGISNDRILKHPSQNSIIALSYVRKRVTEAGSRGGKKKGEEREGSKETSEIEGVIELFLFSIASRASLFAAKLLLLRSSSRSLRSSHPFSSIPCSFHTRSSSVGCQNARRAPSHARERSARGVP